MKSNVKSDVPGGLVLSSPLAAVFVVLQLHHNTTILTCSCS